MLGPEHVGVKRLKGRCQHCRCPAGWPHTRPSSRAQHKPTPAGPQKPVEYPPDPQVSGPTLSATLRLSPPVTEARVTLTWLSAHREGLPGWGLLKAQGPRTPIPAFVDSHVSEFTHSPQTRMLCLGFAQRPPGARLARIHDLTRGAEAEFQSRQRLREGSHWHLNRAGYLEMSHRDPPGPSSRQCGPAAGPRPHRLRVWKDARGPLGAAAAAPALALAAKVGHAHFSFKTLTRTAISKKQK